MAGQQLRCPKCNTVFQVAAPPKPAAAPGASPAPPAPRPASGLAPGSAVRPPGAATKQPTSGLAPGSAAKPSAAGAAPKPAAATKAPPKPGAVKKAAVAGGAAPARKSGTAVRKAPAPKAKGGWMGVIMLLFLLLVLGGGGVGGYFWWKSRQDDSSASSDGGKDGKDDKGGKDGKDGGERPGGVDTVHEDLWYLPSGAQLFAALNLKACLESQTHELLLKDGVGVEPAEKAVLKRLTGVAPTDVDRLTFAGNPSEPGNWAAVVHTPNKVGPDDLKAEGGDLKKTEVGKRTVYERDGEAYFFADSHTVVVSTPGTLQKALQRNGPAELSRGLQPAYRPLDPTQTSWRFAIDAARLPGLNLKLGDLDFAGLNAALPDGTQAVAAEAPLNAPLDVQVLVYCRDEGVAQQASAGLTRALGDVIKAQVLATDLVRTLKDANFAPSGKQVKVTVSVDAKRLPREIAEPIVALKWESPDYCVAALVDPIDKRQAEGRSRLVKNPAWAAPALARGLHHDDPAYRTASLALLREILKDSPDAASAAPDLARTLADPQPALRKAAAELLGQLGPKARGVALSALLARQGDPDAGVRDAVKVALDKLGPPTEDDVKALTAVARDGSLDPAARASALRGLSALDARAELTPLLLETVKDPSKDLRLASVAALQKAAEKKRTEVVPALLAALRDKEDAVRGEAQKALAALGVPAAGKEAETVLASFKDASAPLPARQALAALLARVGGDGRAEAAAALFEGMKDKEKALREACAAALEASGPPPASDVPELARHLTDAEATPELKRYVVRAFAKLGGQVDRNKYPQVSSGLFELLKGDDAALSDAAFEALTALGPAREADVPNLVKLLKDKKAVIRARVYAVQGLAPLGASSKDAAGAVLAALSDDEAALRQTAAQALSKPGPKSKETVQALVKALDDSDRKVRMYVAGALAALPVEEHPLPYLLKAFEDGDDEVVRKAAEALAKYGKPGQADLPILAKALQESPKLRTRLYAVNTLSELGAGALPALEALKTALNDKEMTVRRLALKVVRGLGPDAKAAAAGITPLLKDANPRLKIDAALALAGLKLEGADVVRVLFEAAIDKENPAMAEAVEALKKLGDWAKPAVPFLIEKFGNEEMRPLASSALASVGKDAVAPLVELLKMSKDDAVRIAVLDCLGQIGPPAKGSIGLVLFLANKDSNSDVREAAKKAGKLIQK
jgi:HEAT repeat protein